MKNLLQYKGYKARIFFSAEDIVFYGKLIDINDLVIFEAKSVKQLKSAFYQSVDDYIETLEEIC
ncbi:hypothetical protein [Ferruginibacter sp. HRS2-29]|uniref:hypothetical protein n=1 Tax=Ferruginibacter sp. HRS2-29 TaxID=2487334 RepID=UPI0020CC76A9|nr:hypothetical protein [Ferruginibacter sp. HRS2-29]MCP9750148.1 hypothetical protein [Ferruginibacter sp. HRS2-29]